MDGGTVVALCALACLAALPGLLLRRFGPWGVRAVGLLALLVFWWAALDWPSIRSVSQPPRLAVVPSDPQAPSDPEWQAVLDAAVAGGLEAKIFASDAPLATRMLAARAARGAEVVLAWNGSFDPELLRAGGPSLDGVLVVGPGRRPVVDPDDVQLELLGRAEVGRPLQVGLRLRSGERLPPDGTASLRVFSGAGEPLQASLAGDPVTLVPATEEPLRLSLELGLPDGASLAGEWTVPVSPAGVAALYGPGAERLRVRLAAQGLEVRPIAQLADLADEGVLVLAGALDPAEQEVVARFVEDGGGLFLVGGPDGGALPVAGEPLAELSPFVLARRPELPGSGSGGDGPGAGDGAELPNADPPPEVGQPDPPAGEPPSDPPLPVPDEVEPPTPPVEDLEPVEVDRRQVSLVLLIDRSGSMGELVGRERSKMDEAKASAYETARNLESGDELGVIAFGVAPYPYLNLQPVPGDVELRQTIERLAHKNEGTELHSSLRLAGRWLRESAAAVKHVIVISDGALNGLGEPLASRGVAAALRTQQVSVSLIQIRDPDGQGLLIAPYKAIADSGGGRYISANDPKSIPSLVFAEVERVLGGVGRVPFTVATGERPPATGAQPPLPEPVDEPPPAADDPPPDPPAEAPPEPEPEPEPEEEPSVDSELPASLPVYAVVESPLLGTGRTGAGDYPALAGVLPVQGARGAQVLLATGERGIPLLALANRGLGRVAGWSSSFEEGWAREWLADPELPGRLGAWVEALRPARARRPQVLEGAGSCRHQPELPTRAERRVVEQLGGRWGLASEWIAPRSGSVLVREGRAADLAVFGLASLLAVALVEFLLRRRTAATGL